MDKVFQREDFTSLVKSILNNCLLIPLMTRNCPYSEIKIKLKWFQSFLVAKLLYIWRYLSVHQPVTHANKEIKLFLMKASWYFVILNTFYSNVLLLFLPFFMITEHFLINFVPLSIKVLKLYLVLYIL